MRMYSTCKSNEGVAFNAMLRGVRNPIECAFGRLKAQSSFKQKKLKKNGFETC